MIRPGLSRISQLLADTHLPWQAIHVAGTNGKGSICNYVASMLGVYNQSRLPQLTGHKLLTWGMFTSPHLVDRWDSIAINGRRIEKAFREKAEHRLKDQNITHKLGATEFELLTAVAFKAFTSRKVDLGIVEVGMGGTLDATNILGQQSDAGKTRATPLVTAIAKIGLDHQAYLGTTLPDIASHKAGIIKPGVPVVYDESNETTVKSVFDGFAKRAGVYPTSFSDLPTLASYANWDFLPSEERVSRLPANPLPLVHPHVRQNMSVALRSTWLALTQLGRLSCPANVSSDEFDQVLRDVAQKMSAVTLLTKVRGRLERRTLKFSASGKAIKLRLLLDGAHNRQSALALADEVEILRPVSGGKISWVIAVSGGRSAADLLTPLLKPGDSVHAVEFGTIEDMPWVKPVPSQEIHTAAANLLGEAANIHTHGTDVQAALEAALVDGKKGWTVAAGSLYLIGDVHRLIRNKGQMAAMESSAAARLVD